LVKMAPHHKIIKIGEVGAALDFFKSHGVEQVLFAGHVKRPKFQSIKTDSVGKSWLVKLGLALFKGDDALLAGVTDLLRKEGFQILSTKDIFHDLYLEKGCPTHLKPSPQDTHDIDRGISILQATSPLDIGQAVVIENGLVLGLEAVEGTQQLIQRIYTLKQQKRESGVLVKMAKIGQSTYVDLPTIGPDTVKQCYESGLRGIAIGASHTQVINKTLVIELANEYGMFIQAL
ncbi:MAG: UDP-2,3-diacylglucosamine diphosphatase LpxI, partial [Alphaproteobacteria bacterium]|nr:UDP-2,3-diacylglucosamine diphosphatase LpxI [Alphaproteobacteria bacterium]